jgi:hypothetical protein
MRSEFWYCSFWSHFGSKIHSSLSSAEVKNEWSYTSTPSICIHGIVRNTFSYFASCQVCVCYVLIKEFYIYGHFSKFFIFIDHEESPLIWRLDCMSRPQLLECASTTCFCTLLFQYYPPTCLCIFCVVPPSEVLYNCCGSSQHKQNKFYNWLFSRW